jgi:hypothetical protein
MATVGLIRKHIEALPVDKLFTSRDLLCYGTRSAVDNTVYELKKSGEIVSVTRGVFKKKQRVKPVTVLELATVKAESFGRQIITHAANIAGQLGLLPQKELEHHFATNGRTSSFKFSSIVIHFKGTSTRKMSLGESPAGSVIRALCYLGKERFTEESAGHATRHLAHSDRLEIGRLCSSMPAWLSNFFCSWFQPVSASLSITLFAQENRQTSMQESAGLPVNEELAVYVPSGKKKKYPSARFQAYQQRQLLPKETMSRQRLLI